MPKSTKRVVGLLKRIWKGLPESVRFFLAGPQPQPPVWRPGPASYRCSRCGGIINKWGGEIQGWSHPPLMFHRCYYTVTGNPTLFQFRDGAPAFPVDREGRWL